MNRAGPGCWNKALHQPATGILHGVGDNGQEVQSDKHSGGPEMKESRGIEMAVTPLILLAFAVVGYGFFIGCMIQGGDYLWTAVITGAGVLGAAVVIATSRKTEVHRIRSKIANAEAIVVNDYRLVYASGGGRVGSMSAAATGKVSDVVVKVTNSDACAHRVAVGIDINDEPVHRTVRKAAVGPGATTYVAVPLSREMRLDEIRLLGIRLKQTS